MKRSGRIQQSGFTVIELMILICIIGALISLLLPLISQARARAKATVCAANLRQIGILAFSYANNYGGWILREGNWVHSPWMELERPWVIMVDPTTLGPLALKDIPLRCRTNQILKCPASAEIDTPTNFAVNAIVVSDQPHQSEIAGPTQLSKVRKPSEVVFVTELIDNHAPWSADPLKMTDRELEVWIGTVDIEYLAILPGSLSGFPPIIPLTRHPNGAVNVLYFDGSVRSVRALDLGAKDFDDGIRNHKDKFVWPRGGGMPPPPH